MTERIIDISDQPAKLSISNGLLLVRRDGLADVTVSVSDIAVIVLGHRQVVCTQAALAETTSHGALVVVCDSRSVPVGMMLPLDSHSTQAERFNLQVQAGVPQKKRLWQQLVRAKIQNQGLLLATVKNDSCGLSVMTTNVRSGDVTNVEAQAARRYWVELFGKKFRRDRDSLDQNKLLNYGYAIMRAAVCRAVCASGLHPTFGLHHHNRYNAFALADDLIEPFRPLVDYEVYKLVSQYGSDVILDAVSKAALLSPIQKTYEIEGENRSFFDMLGRLSGSLVGVLEKNRKQLLIPTLNFADK